MTQAVAIRPTIPVQQYEVSDIERMARAIAGSKLFGIASAEQAIALCLIAQAEGRHPASAAQDYHIIQNKPSKKADAMLRDFINAGGKVEWHALDDTIADATFSHPNGGTVRISWDMARAKKAQLSTAMWTKYPRQMLRSRVVSEGVRTIYPLATSGMYVPEEVVEIEATPVPQRSSYRLKQEGGDDVFKSLVAKVGEAKTVPELRALHKEYAATIASWPNDWQASFETEIYDVKLAELEAIRKAQPRAKSLSAEDSAVVREALLSTLTACQDASEIAEWRDANVAAFKSMTKDDQTLVVRERDARLAELFNADGDEKVDADGVLMAG